MTSRFLPWMPPSAIFVAGCALDHGLLWTALGAGLGTLWALWVLHVAGRPE